MVAKLIDADALIAKLKGRIFPASMSQPELTRGVKAGFGIVEREAESMPDASAPLRARIKELEGEVNCQEERIQSLERSLRIAKDEQRSCNQAFANLLQIPVYSWQRNWQTAARLVLALPADADVETINLALLLRDQGGQDA